MGSHRLAVAAPALRARSQFKPATNNGLAPSGKIDVTGKRRCILGPAAPIPSAASTSERGEQRLATRGAAAIPSERAVAVPAGRG